MSAERTLVILKPDAVQKKVVGKIIDRIEALGFDISNIKMFRMKPEVYDAHYAHVKKVMPPDRYEAMTAFFLNNDVISMIVSGENCIAEIRRIMGKTLNAEPGTIRGDFGSEGSKNLIHASDSPEAAETEIRRFYGNGDPEDAM